MSEPAIRLDGLTKRFRTRERGVGFIGGWRALWRPNYRDVVAVEDVSFEIQHGERVAFIGPNGAGKSTTIKMLCGILQPTSGHAEVLGRVPWQDRQQLGFDIGTVFGQRSQLWYHLPARDAFELIAHVYELDREWYRTRLDELVAAFEIGGLLSRPVRQLSLGQRMRCEIVASVLHAPRILFLDEPTIGLDIGAKAIIRELVNTMSLRDGSTVLLTSHDTGDMEQVCDRAIVINDGRLILDRPVRELRGDFLKRKVITLLSAEEHVDIELAGVELVERSPFRVVLEVDTTVTPIDVVVQAAINRGHLRDLTVEDPPMEEVVQQIYGREPATSSRSERDS